MGGSSKQPLYFLLVTVFLDALGIGILIPIVPELITELTGATVSRAAVVGGMLTAVFALVQFVMSPVLGSLSDVIGRRPVILISLLAFGVNYLIMGFASSLTWLFIAQILSGLFGATHGAAAAYVADITESDQRTGPYGMLGAAFGLGFMVGPVMSALVSGWGSRVPFYVAASLALVNVLWGLFALKESLPASERRAFQWSQSSPWGVVRDLRRYPTIITMLWATVLMQFGLQAVTVTWPYFTMYQFAWTAREVGFSLGLYGVVNIVAQGFLLRWLAKRFGDGIAALSGLALMIIGLLGFAFASHPIVAIMFIIPNAMAFMTQGPMRSLMAQRLPLNQQGALQGAIVSCNSAVSIVTPILMPWLFSVNTVGLSPENGFAGAPFLLGAGLATLSSLLVLKTVR
jgi:DHA1 family tetracycline resistance protein-like MFS transporter